MKIHIYRAKDGWRWRAKKRNGRIIAEGGEGYTRRRDAERAVETLVEAFGGSVSVMVAK